MTTVKVVELVGTSDLQWVKSDCQTKRIQARSGNDNEING